MMQKGRVHIKATLVNVFTIQLNDQVKFMHVMSKSPKQERQNEIGPIRKKEIRLLIIPSVFFITPPPFCD